MNLAIYFLLLYFNVEYATKELKTWKKEWKIGLEFLILRRGGRG